MKTCIFLLHLHSIAAFVPAFVPALPYTPGRLSHKSTELAALITIELEKPLGIILEEVSKNEPEGVKVEEISDAGRCNNFVWWYILYSPIQTFFSQH